MESDIEKKKYVHSYASDHSDYENPPVNNETNVKRDSDTRKKDVSRKKIVNSSGKDQITSLHEKWKMLKTNEEKEKEFGNKILADEHLFDGFISFILYDSRNTLILDKLLSLLYEFYLSKEKNLKLFTSQFIPSIIYTYLRTGRKEVQKNVKIETLLRSLYENKSENESLTHPANLFRIPNVHCSSIYHEPTEGLHSESEIAKLKSQPMRIYGRGKIPLAYAGMTHNQPLCTEIWWLFNFYLTQMPYRHGIPHYIEILSRFSSQGILLNQRGNKIFHGQRIPISSKLLIEMSQTAFFCINNGAPSLGEQLLEEMSFRAEYQLWADAMIVINGLRDYMKASDENFHLRGLSTKIPKHEIEDHFLKNNYSIEIGRHIYELI